MCEKYEDFLKERCSLEQSYAKNLRKLVKKFESRSSLNTEQQQQQSHLKYLSISFGETKQIAEQHEFVSKKIHKEIISKLSNLIQNLKDERKKYIEDKQKLTDQLEKSEDLLKKSKIKYRQAFKELEKSKETLEKYEHDVKITQNTIRKQQDLCEHKYRVCGSYRSDYARQLQETNNLKFEYFEEKLPNLFDSLKKLEEIRIKNLKLFILDCASIESDILPRIKESYNKIEDSVHLVSIQNDVEAFLKIYKDDLKWNHKYQDLREQSIISNQIVQANDDQDDEERPVERGRRRGKNNDDEIRNVNSASSDGHFTFNRKYFDRRAQSTMSAKKYPTIRFIKNFKTFDRIKSALISKV